MSIDSEAEKDLSLSSEDAENVTGGRMTKKHKKGGKKSGIIHSKGLPTTYSDEPAVDPVADEEGT